jgi:hypothetical protein
MSLVETTLPLEDRLYRAKQYFGTSATYNKVIEQIETMFYQGEINEAEELLKTLPDDRLLMAKLIEELKTKSVYKTLEKIVLGKANVYEQLKGWMSLGTHAVIEIERGNKEYSMLIALIYEKIGVIMFSPEFNGKAKETV